MHEMSIAMSIVDIAISEAAKADAQTIDEIEIEIGQLAGVMLESLSFCLQAAAKNTLAEPATFTLVTIAGQGHCLACQQDIPINEFPAQCPICQGFGVSITAGTELKIRSISINDDTNRRER